MKRFEASDNEPSSVELHHGHGVGHPSKQFQDPNTTLSAEHEHPTQKRLVLCPYDNSFLHPSSIWAAGPCAHPQCTTYSTTPVVVAGTVTQETWEVNPSSGMPMYSGSTSSAQVLGTHVKLGSSPVTSSSQAGHQGRPF